MNDSGAGAARSPGAPKPERAKIEAMRAYIRREGGRFLDDPNITSIGTGYKVTDGHPTDTLSLQFTVRTKADEGDRPEALGSEPIPPTIKINDETVPTDVLERDYAPSYTEVQAEESDIRKLRCDPIEPGISIGNLRTTAGTLGLVVFDEETGAACVLSNWHVLHTGEGEIGDTIVQPGPYDDNNTGGNVCGRLLRSFLGEAGDCAIATISNRDFLQQIVELGESPTDIVRVELGDRVVKSGRTTGVTRGVVRRVDVIVEMSYDGKGKVRIGAFEIAPLPDAGADYEISKGGDSGAAWLIDDDGAASGLLAGLHFGGESDSSPDEHAVACYAHSVFKKLGIRLPSADASEAVGSHGLGYDPHFLKADIPVPVPTREVADDTVEFDADGLIPYTHFSVSLSKDRGFAHYVAWNIDGSRLKAISRTGISFKLDPRIEPKYQWGDDLYSANNLDRGHIARRADLCWGSLGEANQANEDSFFFTNITPQHQAFNQSRRHGLWGRLEDAIYEDVDVADLRIAVFGGPIFRKDDLEYRDAKIPRDFWKLLAYHDAADDTTKVRAYVLTQRSLLDDLEVLDLDPFQMYQVPLDRIRDDSGLDFSALEPFDTFTAADGPERLEQPSSARRARLIDRDDQILG